MLNHLKHPKPIQHILTPLAAGAATTLAFAPYRIAVIAIVTVAVLYGNLRNASPREALWRGWCFGLGLFATGLSWLHVVIHDHGAMPLALAWLLTLLFTGLLALLFAAQAYVLARFSHLARYRQAFSVFPLSWVVFEWLRSTLFTGFPWLLLGVSQTDGPLGALLPYVGIGGTSFVVAFTAVALWHCLHQIGKVSKARVLAIITLLGLHYFIPYFPLWALAGFFVYNILFLRNQSTWAFTLLVAIYLTAGMASFNTFTTPGKTLTASMVQINVPNRMKWEPSQVETTLIKYLDRTRELWRSDIIIWPESSIAKLKQELPEIIDGLKQLAINNDTTFIFGLPSYDVDTQQYHNSLYVLGKQDGEYHKRHLVPFGEYVPLQHWLRGVFSFLDLPMSVLEPGDSQQMPLQAQNIPFAPFICFETAYPAYLANALPDAQLLVVISDDSWFGESSAGQQHLQIAQALAAMGGRGLLHSTNTGVTAIVNAKGRVTAILPAHQPGVLTGQIQAMSGMTPWAWLNHWPIWPWLALTLFIYLLAWRFRQAPANNQGLAPSV